MLSKQNAIKKYLSRHGYNGNKCVNVLGENGTNEIYDLYIHNDERLNLTSNFPGYYGVYYKINKRYDNMVLSYTKAIKRNTKDSGALNELYSHWNKNSDVPSKITKVCDILEKKNPKEFLRFNRLRILSIKNNPEPVKLKNEPEQPVKTITIVIVDPFNKINDSIETFVKSNEINKIYELYDQCDNDELKKKYLSKVTTIIKPTKMMIYDIMRLDFDNTAPLEIGLVKSVYAGCKINLQNIELENLCDKYNQSNDDGTKKACLIKLVSMKDFKPTKEMLDDLLRLDFTDQAPLEIGLIKSVFGQRKRNEEKFDENTILKTTNNHT